MRRCIYPVLAFAILGGAVLTQACSPAVADDNRDIGQWLKDVSQDYAENAWIEKPKFRPLGYMRPSDDKGWRTRMLALHAAVTQGKPAIPALIDALESGDDAQRIFAAQVLGYLGVDVPIAPLLKAARDDKTKAVRLYAVDALGMRGGAVGKVDWTSLRKRERNGDVRKHIDYAVERKDAAIEAAIIASLKKWNPQSIDTAVIGKPAPDFELFTATNEKVRLSSFRGKKSVVLVFIYGDT